MSKILVQFAAVGLAGTVGAMLRFLVALVFNRPAFPLGTLLINITGSFMLGWFMTAALEQRIAVSETLRIAVAVGFIGTYTTFSTYMFESDKMLSDGAWVRATLYLLGSVALGLAAVRCGVVLGKRW